jgi:hypothetical protein
MLNKGSRQFPKGYTELNGAAEVLGKVDLRLDNPTDFQYTGYLRRKNLDESPP